MSYRWCVRYTIFSKTKYANSGLQKFVNAKNIEQAVKKAKSKFIRIDGVMSSSC